MPKRNFMVLPPPTTLSWFGDRFGSVICWCSKMLSDPTSAGASMKPSYVLSNSLPLGCSLFLSFR
jgi:hypothetical protein